MSFSLRFTPVGALGTARMSYEISYEHFGWGFLGSIERVAT